MKKKPRWNLKVPPLAFWTIFDEQRFREWIQKIQGNVSKWEKQLLLKLQCSWKLYSNFLQHSIPLWFHSYGRFTFMFSNAFVTVSRIHVPCAVTDHHASWQLSGKPHSISSFLKPHFSKKLKISTCILFFQNTNLISISEVQTKLSKVGASIPYK